MDKGIRAYAGTYFAAQNALRIDAANELYKGPKANTVFRKAVMAKLMEEFGVTLASAATHYNEALIRTRKATPEAVEGLGRPADKKGGRKKKVEAPAAAGAEPNTADLTDSNLTPGGNLVLVVDDGKPADAAPAANEGKAALAA